MHKYRKYDFIIIRLCSNTADMPLGWLKMIPCPTQAIMTWMFIIVLFKRYVKKTFYVIGHCLWNPLDMGYDKDEISSSRQLILSKCLLKSIVSIWKIHRSFLLEYKRQYNKIVSFHNFIMHWLEKGKYVCNLRSDYKLYIKLINQVVQ